MNWEWRWSTKYWRVAEVGGRQLDHSLLIIMNSLKVMTRMTRASVLVTTSWPSAELSILLLPAGPIWKQKSEG